MRGDEEKSLGLLEYTPNGYDHPKDASVGNGASSCNPAEGDYQAGFHVAYHGTAHWTSTDNNEKLGKIDEGCKAAALHANVSAHPPEPRGCSFTYRENHYPLVGRYNLNNGKPVCPWNDIEE